MYLRVFLVRLLLSLEFFYNLNSEILKRKFEIKTNVLLPLVLNFSIFKVKEIVLGKVTKIVLYHIVNSINVVKKHIILIEKLSLLLLDMKRDKIL